MKHFEKKEKYDLAANKLKEYKKNEK